MNKTGWIIFVAVVIALIGGLVAWTRISNPPIDISNVNIDTVIGANSQNGSIADHAKGSTENKVVLVEYGDFQCPACSTLNERISTLVDEYDSKLTFVFRNFPLTSIHPNARAASAAAEAAGLQGKYWEMHDLLYKSQDSWSNLDGTRRTEAFNDYAVSLDLDMEAFKRDVASSAVNQKISFDQAIARKLNVSATPTFYLNGKELDKETAADLGAGKFESIKAKIDELYK